MTGLHFLFAANAFRGELAQRSDDNAPSSSSNGSSQEHAVRAKSRRLMTSHHLYKQNSSNTSTRGSRVPLG